MLKRSAPSRARRIGGGALVTLAALAIGYSAWAAEPGAADAGTSNTPASKESGNLHRPSSLVLRVDDAILRFDDVDDTSKIRIAGARITATRDTAERLRKMAILGTVQLDSASEQAMHVTLSGASPGSLPDVATVRDFLIDGESAIVEDPGEPTFRMTFDKGCTVKLTFSTGGERILKGSACQIAARP